MKNQEIIIDCSPLIGKSNRSIKHAHRYAKEFKAKKAKLRFIRKNSLKKRSFYCSYDAKLLDILKKNSSINYVVVPNVAQYVRDLNNYGLIMMGIRKLLQLGLSLFSLIHTGIKQGPGILKRDMSNIVVLLTDIEMVKLKKIKPKIVLLHPQMTDLFLANDNYKPIKKFSDFVRKKYKAEPGLFTNNISMMVKKLDEWDSGINCICTPINKKGYMMKPSQKEAEDTIMKTKRKIIGYDITCGDTIDSNKSLVYAKKLGINKVIIEKVQ